MRQRIEKYRRSTPSRFENYVIGCILLTQPFFLPEESWIPVPSDWKPNIVRGKGYDLIVEPGKTLLQELERSLASIPAADRELEISGARFGTPHLVTPRLGQGAFRVLVTDAYQRRCAVTGERVLPVLEAAHIRPYAEGGEHRVNNGLLLRRDFHALLDRGYVSVTPDYHLEVSRRIKAEWENGRDYYAKHGAKLVVPPDAAHRPSEEYLRWHNEERYLAS